jgi:DNA mismatch endonuclease (patch repair protein)
MQHVRGHCFQRHEVIRHPVKSVADIFSRKKRSEIMSRVKGRGNLSTEVLLIKIFRAFGLSGWKRNSTIFGKPDFVFPTARLAIFVDGCFWHGCPIHGALPSSNRSFWKEKLTRNKLRDRQVVRELRKAGWITLRIWQHDLRRPHMVARRISAKLAASSKISWRT